MRHRYNPVKRKAFRAGETVMVFVRDNGICGLCQKKVNYDEIEIDHITPLSRGGAHEPGNWQLAHKVCNRAKRALLPGEQPRIKEPATELFTVLFPFHESLTVGEIAQVLKLKVEVVQQWIPTGKLIADAGNPQCYTGVMAETNRL